MKAQRRSDLSIPTSRRLGHGCASQMFTLHTYTFTLTLDNGIVHVRMRKTVRTKKEQIMIWSSTPLGVQ